MKKSLLPLFRELWQPRFRVRMIASLLLLIFAKVCNVVAPLFYKHVIDALSPSALTLAMAIPFTLIFAHGAARIGSMLFTELQMSLFITVTYRVMRELAVKNFVHMHNLSLRFHLERRTGGLSRIIERGVNSIQEGLDMMVWVFAPAILELTLTLGIIAWYFGPLMTGIIFVTICLYVFFTVLVSKRRMDIRREAVEQNNKANARAVDSLLNYETVKYFGNEAYEATHYDAIQASYEKVSIQSRISLAVLNCGQSAIITVGLVLIMLLEAQRIISGQGTVSDLVLIVIYLIQLYGPLNFLGVAYRTFTQALIDMEKMFELLDVQQEIADVPGAPALQTRGGRVEFDAVDFSYDARRPILRGVSFVAEPGQTVAIVGPSGAGKSTLARLLFRFYDVTGGQIRIDGQDISKVSQQSLRAAIGIVPQDTVLFNDTLRYNIAYGRPQATPAEVEEAARLAQIDTFCKSLPDGYDTIVGERGLKLSGGEKQRVAIARTFLKHPSILIFDEATSALDTHTEKEIQASLRGVSQGHTTLVIAHRLSTIADANLILVLDGGQVVERGNHAELLSKNGLYAALWRRQQESEEKSE